MYFPHDSGLSRDQGSGSDTRSSKHALVALNFRRRTERLCRIVGQFDCGSSFHVGDFSDQADQIGAAAGIASAKIVGEQRAPTGAESNSLTGNPLARIEEVSCIKEFCTACAGLARATEIGMQAEYFVDVSASE